MMNVAMSAAAAGLLRALLARAGIDRRQVLLSEITSVDWQSLTYSGERHLLALRVAGPGAGQAVDRLITDLGEAEFAVPGQIVADIALAGEVERDPDGGLIVMIEALTIAE